MNIFLQKFHKKKYFFNTFWEDKFRFFCFFFIFVNNQNLLKYLIFDIFKMQIIKLFETFPIIIFIICLHIQ